MSIFSHKQPWLIVVSCVGRLICSLSLIRTILEQVLAAIVHELRLSCQSLTLILGLNFELLRILSDELLCLLTERGAHFCFRFLII